MFGDKKGKSKEKMVMWFKDITKDDIPLVGGKGANLGEMTRNNFPIPGGFCVTAQAFFYFLREAKIEPKIESLLKGLDAENSKALNSASKEIKKLILGAKLPADLAKAIRDYYQELGGFPVAVRSSATAEDLPEASFAGQQATFLNNLGAEQVLKSVLECYASLYEPRAI